MNWSTAGPIFPGAGTLANSCSQSKPCNVFAVDPQLRTPYVLNWNLNLQQALTPGALLQVAYVGNRGVKLYSITDPNQADPALAMSRSGSRAVREQLARPFSANCPSSINGGLGRGGPCFPYIGFVNLLGNQSSSIYHGLQITLTKRYSHGLYLLAGYTYAHAIDTAGDSSNLATVPQNSLNFAGERGNSDFDIRHRLTLSATYELPAIKSKWQILKGWQLTSLVTLQGGRPMNFFDSGSDFTFTGEGKRNGGNDRWNIAGDPRVIHWSQTAPIPFFDAASPVCLAVATTPELLKSLQDNTGCWAQNGTVLYPNALGTFGNTGRNVFRGPGFKDWDASVAKNFTLGEKLRLQFRGEVFNALNHPSFSSVRKNLFSSTLGKARSTPDISASNPVVGSGGSRHIQLGAKLIW